MRTGLIPILLRSRPKGGLGLIYGEAQGLGIDFTDTVQNAGLGSVAVRDTTTPANNLSNVPADSFLTQSGTSPKLVLWSDGLYRWTGHNLVTPSEQFDDGTWAKTSCTISANAIVAPNGTLTADKLIPSAGSVSPFINSGVITSIVGAQYTHVVNVKPGDFRYFVLFELNSGSGAGFVVFDTQTVTVSGAGNGASTSWGTITDAGGGFYKLAYTFAATGATVSNRIYISGSGSTITNVTGDGVLGSYLWGAQSNRGTVPTAYHVTTAAAWYGVPIEYDPTTAKFYALVEPQATNLALYASDFTNAAWVKSNMTAALTATGPDGVANSASTLTATAGNATALQAITSGSASRVTSMFVKRRTGSGVVNLTQDNGGTWTAVTVTAGWTNLPLAAVTSANPTVGIRIVTSGDAVDVAWFQHELTAVTSPIWTGSATVTRAGDNVNMSSSTFPYSETAGTFISKFRQSVTGGAAAAILRPDVSAFFTTPNFSAGLTCFDGTNTTTLGNGVLSTVADNKAAVAWSGVTTSGSVNGAAALTGIYDGSWNVVTPIGIGGRYSTGGEQINGRISQVIFVPRRMTDADLALRTAP